MVDIAYHTLLLSTEEEIDRFLFKMLRRRPQGHQGHQNFRNFIYNWDLLSLFETIDSGLNQKPKTIKKWKKIRNDFQKTLIFT